MKVQILLFLVGILCVSNVWTAKSTEEWKTRTIYQLLTDRFARTDGSTDGCGDLGNYCGGTFKGIENNLDYIQGMGFDAIWISPIPENYPGSYHGYHATDWYKLNSQFGSEEDFKSLVTAMHKRDIWMMVDVVANHVGPVDMDFGQVHPFDKSEYYHDKCQINNWNDEHEVEFCRLADLPDLNQDNNDVRTELKNWISDLVTKYDVDGLRVDTIPEVKREFWDEFTAAAGCYLVGEVFNGDMDYVASYQPHLPGLLNYPMYYTMRNVWMNGGSMYDIRTTIASENEKFQDASVLGTFTDNHDNSRFLHDHGDVIDYKGAVAFSLFAPGIPIVYYGTEQEYAGGDDPQNRETLWTKMDTSSDMYNFIKKLVTTRKEHKAYAEPLVERYVDDHFYAFTRGDVLIALTNTHDRVEYSVSFLPDSFTEGTTVCNVMNDNDCTTVSSTGIDISLSNGEVKVYTVSQSMVSE
jgi:alpha-amylase